jgi:hypothetical protein
MPEHDPEKWVLTNAERVGAEIMLKQKDGGIRPVKAALPNEACC